MLEGLDFPSLNYKWVSGHYERFAYIDILANPEIRATLPQVSDWPTFPQLFVDGELVGHGNSDAVASIAGNGNGGRPRSTGWQLFEVDLSLEAGSHTLRLGGYNNKKTYHDESTQILIDDLLVTALDAE